MGRSDDFTPHEARQIAERLFGDRFNLFNQGGMFYAGRFLDSGRRPDGGEVPAFRRRQEVFGAGKTLREALRFATGRQVIYSIAGMNPGPTEGTGAQPQIDKYGRIVGWMRGGVFTKSFPSRTLVTA